MPVNRLMHFIFEAGETLAKQRVEFNDNEVVVGPEPVCEEGPQHGLYLDVGKTIQWVSLAQSPKKIFKTMCTKKRKKPQHIAG